MTITKRTLPDGRVEITYNGTDELKMRAIHYQDSHGLSMTPEAIRARMKTIQRQQDRLQQEGATGLEIPFEGRIRE